MPCCGRVARSGRTRWRRACSRRSPMRRCSAWGGLVGTQAFLVLGSVLGVRWDGSGIRTEDVDAAGERTLDVSGPGLKADVPSVLDSLEMGFLPVPGLSHGAPSTSFKVRGKALRVDLLARRLRGERKPVLLPRFAAAAQPQPYLQYLTDKAITADVLWVGDITYMCTWEDRRVPAPSTTRTGTGIAAQRLSSGVRRNGASPPRPGDPRAARAAQPAPGAACRLRSRRRRGIERRRCARSGSIGCNRAAPRPTTATVVSSARPRRARCSCSWSRHRGRS